MTITVRRKAGSGSWHVVYVDGREVGVVTRYSDGSWWALHPQRYPLGAANRQDAAERLVADLNREGEQA